MIIKEQLLIDEAIGLSLKISKTKEGGMVISYFLDKDVPFDSRSITFGRNGRMEKCGTSLGVRRVR